MTQTFSVRWDLSGVFALLDSYIARLANPKEFMGEVAAIMREDVANQFQAGGIPRWAPLNAKTVQQKLLQGYPRPSRNGEAPLSLMQRGNFGPENILMRTGALYSSWTNKDDPHHIEEITDESVAIGSSLPYANFHQSDEPRKKLPRRAVFITDSALNKIQALAKQRLLEETT